MPRTVRLKVYRVNYDGTNERLVAAASQRRAAARIGCTLGTIRNYGGETGNEADRAAALAEPGAVFERPMTWTSNRPAWIKIKSAPAPEETRR